jgi:hypothetical protein
VREATRVAKTPAPTLSPEPTATSTVALAGRDALAAGALSKLDLNTRSRVLTRLQRDLGNANVAALLRQHAEAPPRTAEELDRDYRAALGKDWARAGELLNGFNDKDIEIRTRELGPEQRDAMKQALPEWNSRVRAALLDRSYEAAMAAGDWQGVAIHLNGFNTEGIDERLGKIKELETLDKIFEGARTGMSGVSQRRILDGVARAYQRNGVTDPTGTYVLKIVDMMQKRGVDADIATKFVQQQLHVKIAGGASPGGGDVAGEKRSSAVKVLSAAMGAAVAAAVEPTMLAEGRLAHTLIGAEYAKLNPPSLVDPTLITIVRALKRAKAFYDALYARIPEDLLESLAVRPDILDLGKMQVYEIKSIQSAKLAVPEMLEYIELLESFKIKDFLFHPGSPTNPGTSGVLPAGPGWLVWACPWPGGIVYEFLLQPENPWHARERLPAEARGESGVGVETITGLGLVGVAAAGALAEVEIPAAVVGGFERLIPVLADAARAAGQRLPQGLALGGAH